VNQAVTRPVLTDRLSAYRKAFPDRAPEPPIPEPLRLEDRTCLSRKGSEPQPTAEPNPPKEPESPEAKAPPAPNPSSSSSAPEAEAPEFDLGTVRYRKGHPCGKGGRYAPHDAVPCRMTPDEYDAAKAAKSQKQNANTTEAGKRQRNENG